MVRSLDEWRRGEATAPPAWVKPQLTKLADQPPGGPDWLHEIKFDGYRMHARFDRGAVRLLTRTGLNWTHKYSGIASAVASLPARQAYLDGELCGVRPDGTTSFSLIQNASDTGNGEALVFFPVRSYPSRRRSYQPPAAKGPERTAPGAAVRGKAAAAIQRPPDRTRPGLL
jgi:ATP dependent DNA ligase domain